MSSLPEHGFWSRLSSFLFPKVYDRRRSKLSGELEVRYEQGRYVLNSPKANYSFGSLQDVFAETFAEFELPDRDIDSALILGFGAGSVAELLLEAGHTKTILVGVEKDRTVLEIATEYFDLAQYRHLELHEADAVEHLKTEDRQFDLVVVDVFVDLEVPGSLETPQFVQRLAQVLETDGLLIFNRMYASRLQKVRTHEFIEVMEIFFPKVIQYRIRDNLMLVVDRYEALG
ncbi:MAG: fused MFS/spermidine synthase [Bacteroidota bacterium]